MPQYFETYRAVAAPWQCDQNGHMNVQFYVAAISDAAYALLGHLTLWRSGIAERRISTVWANVQLDFKKELQAGDGYFVESTIAGMGARSLTYRHLLKLAESGETAMSAEVLAICINLDTRKSTPLPPDIIARAKAIIGCQPNGV